MGSAEHIVDLDRGLVRSDILHEVAWARVAQDKSVLVRFARAALSGKEALRAAIADGAPMIERLPLDETTLNDAKTARDAGQRVVLTTAFNEELATRIAQDLDLFDEIRLTEASAPPPARTADQTRALIKALRPHQWLKNTLVFLPVIAAHEFSFAALFTALIAFIVFSLTASSVYLLNDLLDLASDRKHPRKRARPFASGALPLSWGSVLAPGLLAVSGIVAALIGWEFFVVMLLYFIITTAYSFDLKRRIVVDICTLAGLYTLRIVAGGASTDTPLSVWILAFSIFFFFSLAAVKRQAELVGMDEDAEGTAHGRSYVRSDLPLVTQMSIASGYLSVLVIALYFNSDAVRELYDRTQFLWGIPLILLYWISRMVMMTHRGWMHDDPIVYAVRDRMSQICVGLILLLAVFGSI
jgi:4-hydroxybenzoate polyprenyltransferase